MLVGAVGGREGKQAKCMSHVLIRIADLSADSMAFDDSARFLEIALLAWRIINQRLRLQYDITQISEELTMEDRELKLTSGWTALLAMLERWR